MSSVNKVMLVGHLGADPDVRVMNSGECVATIRMATTEVWKDKTTREKKEQVDWHRVVFYGRLAEIVRDYVKKGRQIFVEGRLHTRKWQDQQTGQDRYTTEVVATEMKILSSGASRDGGMGGGSDQSARSAPAMQQSEQLASYTDMGDDIPF